MKSLNPFQLARYRIIEKSRKMGVYSESVDDIYRERGMPVVFSDLRKYGRDGPRGFRSDFKDQMEHLFTEALYEDGLLPNRSSAKLIGKAVAIPWFEREKLSDPMYLRDRFRDLLERLEQFSPFLMPNGRQHETDGLIETAGNAFSRISRENRLDKHRDIILYLMEYGLRTQIKMPDKIKEYRTALARLAADMAVGIMNRVAEWELLHGSKHTLDNFMGHNRQLAIDGHKNPFWPFYQVYKDGWLVSAFSKKSATIEGKKGSYILNLEP